LLISSGRLANDDRCLAKGFKMRVRFEKIVCQTNLEANLIQRATAHPGYLQETQLD
jgi:hypothetical protein